MQFILIWILRFVHFAERINLENQSAERAEQKCASSMQLCKKRVKYMTARTTLLMGTPLVQVIRKNVSLESRLLRDSLKDSWDFRIATSEMTRKQRRMGRRTDEQTRRTSKRSKESSRTGIAFGGIRKSLVAKTRQEKTAVAASMVGVMQKVTTEQWHLWQKRDTCATSAAKRSPPSPGCDFT